MEGIVHMKRFQNTLFRNMSIVLVVFNRQTPCAAAARPMCDLDLSPNGYIPIVGMHRKGERNHGKGSCSSLR